VACNGRARLSYPIRNTDRTIGGPLAGQIALRHGSRGLAPETIVVEFHGSAGQSFDAFGVAGLHLHLTGQANDYVGKGLGGGEIVIRPPVAAPYVWHHNVILGNTALYGATGGELNATGRAGERFAVRNSGARAVQELVCLRRVVRAEDRAELRTLLQRHLDRIGSPRARAILDDWDTQIQLFWRIAPVEQIARLEAANEGGGGRAGSALMVV
jgi:glutamate synthase domain-containing protein 3